MKKIAKTNVARLLDQAKISYSLVPYIVDENDLSAGHIAEQLGEDIEQVFKTLVLRGDKTGHFVCVVPGEDEVDLKKAAKISGNKKADLIPMKELLPTTGYIRGGCSPIGMKKQAYVELRTQQKSVELANQNFQVVQNRYVNQLALITDMIDASNVKLNAELQEVNAQINIAYTYYNVKYVTGKI